MGTTTYELSLASTPANVAGSTPAWVNPERLVDADGQVAAVQWTGANQTSRAIECLGFDVSGLPLLALPKQVGVKLVGAADGLTNNYEYFSNVSMRYQGSQTGIAIVTTNGDAVTLTTTPSDHVYNGTLGTDSFNISGLSRDMMRDATFGPRVIGHGRPSTTSSDSLLLDAVHLLVTAGDRKKLSVSGSAVSGYVKFEAERGFVDDGVFGDTVYDWRDDMKTGAGLDVDAGDAQVARCRLRWRLCLIDDIDDASVVDYVQTSVSDSRSWSRFPEGDDPLGIGYEQDPKETLWVYGLTHGQTLYAWVRVELYDENGDVAEAGAWSDSASATRNTLYDPIWMSASVPSKPDDGPVEAPTSGPDLDGRWLLFEWLVGGQNTGATSEDLLGVDMSNVVDDSYWKGALPTMQAALDWAGEWKDRCGFLLRARDGVLKKLDSASSSIEWYAFGGGVNNDLSNIDATGVVSSPAMMNSLLTKEHSRNLSSPDKEQVASLCDDIGQLASLDTVIVSYSACIASNHIVVWGEQTHERVLKSQGLHNALSNNLLVALDTFCNVAPYDPVTGQPSPELKIARALGSTGRRWLAERRGKKTNENWLTLDQRTDDVGLQGDIGVWNLMMDDDAYTAAKTLGARMDLNRFVKDTDLSPALRPERDRMLLRVNASVCQLVAAGANNRQKCLNAMDVILDVLYTWQGRVVCSLCNQSQWDELQAADKTWFFEAAEAVLLRSRARRSVIPFASRRNLIALLTDEEYFDDEGITPSF